MKCPSCERELDPKTKQCRFCNFFKESAAFWKDLNEALGAGVRELVPYLDKAANYGQRVFDRLGVSKVIEFLMEINLNPLAVKEADDLSRAHEFLRKTYLLYLIFFPKYLLYLFGSYSRLWEMLQFFCALALGFATHEALTKLSKRRFVPIVGFLVVSFLQWAGLIAPIFILRSLGKKIKKQ